MARDRKAATNEGVAVLIAAIQSNRDHLIEQVAAETAGDPARIGRGLDLILGFASHAEPSRPEAEAVREISARMAREGAAHERVLAGYIALHRAVWDVVSQSSVKAPASAVELADRLVHGLDVAVEAMAEAFAEVEIELAASYAERRRSVLEELLSAPRATPGDRARIRQRLERYGLEPDEAYRLTLVEPIGRKDQALEEGADALERSIRAPVPHHRRQPGIRLPVVLEWRGRILILARADWVGVRRLRSALSRVLRKDWVAVDVGRIEGFEAISSVLAQAEYAVGVASDLGRRSWIGDPSTVALETTFLLDQSVVQAAIQHELGALLADERMGEELIETLETHLASRQNTRETARRLHLSPRTVTYRLGRIETLLGISPNGDASVRLAAALLALRVSRQSRGSRIASEYSRAAADHAPGRGPRSRSGGRGRGPESPPSRRS